MNPQQPNRPQKLTVLLIEDDRSFAAMVKAAIEEDGTYKLHGHIPKTSADALLTIRNNPQQFAALVIDVQLENESQGGLEVIKQLPRHGVLIPIVLLTSSAEAMIEVKKHTLEYRQVHGFLNKTAHLDGISFGTSLCSEINYVRDKESIVQQLDKRKETMMNAGRFLESEFKRRDYPIPDPKESEAIIGQLSSIGIPKRNEGLIKKIADATLNELERQNLLTLPIDQARQVSETVTQGFLAKNPTKKEVAEFVLEIEDLMNELSPAQKAVRKARK